VCSFFGVSDVYAETTLKFAHESSVKTNNQESKTYKADESILISGTENLLIEATGRLPLLIVPSIAKTEFKLDLPKVEDWPSARTQYVLEKSISELLSMVFLAQKDIQQKRFDEALKVIDQARIKYPKVQQLSTLRVSTLVLLGRREEALSSIKAALLVDPANEELGDLLNALEGKAIQRKGASL
jgi:hypothetical protein